MNFGNKKGSQVGIVMSFVIFILSIMFIFSIITPPANVDKSKLYSMGILEHNLRKNISEDIKIVLVNDNVGVENCLSLNVDSLGLSGKEFIIVDSSENEAKSHYSSNIIYIDKNAGTENMFNVYFSDYPFEKNLISSNEICDPAKIYGFLEKEIVREPKIVNLIESYESNYTQTKEEMGIPTSEEFNLFFIYDNSTKIGTERDTMNTNIFAKTIQVEYLDNKGNEKIGEVIMKIW